MADLPKFRPGDKLPIEVTFDYKGIPQDGKFLMEIGRGIYPAGVEKTYPEIDFNNIAGAMDWAERKFAAEYTLPSDLEEGTYYLRGVLRTLTDVTVEGDFPAAVNYNVFEVVPA